METEEKVLMDLIEKLNLIPELKGEKSEEKPTCEYCGGKGCEKCAESDDEGKAVIVAEMEKEPE